MVATKVRVMIDLEGENAEAAAEYLADKLLSEWQRIVSEKELMVKSESEVLVVPLD